MKIRIMLKNSLRWMAFACLVCSTSQAADDFASLEAAAAPLGRLIVTSFASAPFPHPARAGGHYYQGQFFSAAGHYSDGTVALFIPKGFHLTGPVDFVVHFHGWRHTVAGTLPEYHLVEQFAAANRNAILIVPQGPYNAPDSFGGKLEDTNGFKDFMAEAVEKLAARGVFPAKDCTLGGIILSGHSGGYHVIASILDHGGLTDHIREVWLFDALYGNEDNFVNWQKNERGRFLDIYTDHGGTRENSESLIARFNTGHTPFFSGTDTNMVPENLRTNDLIFLHTDMVHNDVLARRHTFEIFLNTSFLPAP